jgi:hypothetical protein
MVLTYFWVSVQLDGDIWPDAIGDRCDVCGDLHQIALDDAVVGDESLV